MNRPTPIAVFALTLYVAAVAALTGLTSAQVLPVGDFASSPRRFAAGKFWLLFSNGLVCDHPLVASLGALAGFGIVMLVVCGSRLLWIAAALGHVFSTLSVYAGIALTRLLAPTAFDGVLDGRDMGISAVCAAWLGAVAATLWRHPNRSARAKGTIVASCVAIGTVAWVVRPDLTALDTDHLFAFAIGVAVATVPVRRLVHADAVYAFTANGANRVRAAIVAAVRAGRPQPQQRP